MSPPSLEMPSCPTDQTALEGCRCCIPNSCVPPSSPRASRPPCGRSSCRAAAESSSRPSATFRSTFSLATPGSSTKTSTWSSSSWMSTSGSRMSSPRAVGGAAADVAERLDLQFRLAAFAQGGPDIDSIDAADFSAGVLEFAGSGEFLARFGQLAQFFDQSAQSAQQPAQTERAFDDLIRRFRRILFRVIFADSCHGNSPFVVVVFDLGLSDAKGECSPIVGYAADALAQAVLRAVSAFSRTNITCGASESVGAATLLPCSCDIFYRACSFLAGCRAESPSPDRLPTLSRRRT